MIAGMRGFRQSLMAIGGIVTLVMGGALLREDARLLFAPVLGMLGGLTALALASHERLKLRVEALEQRLAQREWRERYRARESVEGTGQRL
jgi:hypothetical protein